MSEVNTVTYEELGDADEDTVELYIPKDALGVATGDDVNIRTVILAPDLKLVILGGAAGDITAKMQETAGDEDQDHQKLPVPKSVLGTASAPSTISSFTKYEPASGPVLVAALGE